MSAVSSIVKTTSSIAFRGTMIGHRDDCTQRFIDLMTLELGLYARSVLTLLKKKKAELKKDWRF